MDKKELEIIIKKVKEGKIPNLCVKGDEVAISEFVQRIKNETSLPLYKINFDELSQIQLNNVISEIGQNMLIHIINLEGKVSEQAMLLPILDHRGEEKRKGSVIIIETKPIPKDGCFSNNTLIESFMNRLHLMLQL